MENIVYHPDYNFDIDDLCNSPFSFIDINLPINTHRYSGIYDILRSYGVKSTQFKTPTLATLNDLLLVHTQDYLTKLNNSQEISCIFEYPALSSIDIRNIQKYVINSMLLAVGGTVIGCQIAIDQGWAINLSGGYHHAKSSSGGGFCVYNDIAIAIKKIWQRKPETRVLIVDLDAHQGNGYSEIFLNDSRVYIFDVYNQHKYPAMFEIDCELRDRINYHYPVNSKVNDEEYMTILTDHLFNDINDCHPDLIIYNAGTDVYFKDNCGNMGLTEKGIICRDEYVFSVAEKHHIPILMLLAGGYTPDSSIISAHSILNIIKNKNHSACTIM